MKRLLLWKHWQVFLLTYGLLIIMYIVMVAAFIGMASLIAVSAGIFSLVGVMMLIGLLSFSVIYIWFWTVGTSLQAKLPEDVKMNVNLFKLAVLFPIVYMVVIFLFIGVSIATDTLGGEPNSWFGLIIIPHLFTMFCMFYIFYFIAKSLKSVELGRMAHVGDYIGEFFLLWFFFIGVWLIQPKLNRWFSEEEGGVEQHLVG